MDSCVITSVTQLLPSTEQVKSGLALIGSVVITASLLTSALPTPPPGSRLARLNRYLELSALLFGRAKDTGVLRATPAADKALTDAIAIARNGKKP